MSKMKRLIKSIRDYEKQVADDEKEIVRDEQLISQRFEKIYTHIREEMVDCTEAIVHQRFTTIVRELENLLKELRYLHTENILENEDAQNRLGEMIDKIEAYRKHVQEGGRKLFLNVEEEFIYFRNWMVQRFGELIGDEIKRSHIIVDDMKKTMKRIKM